MVLPILTGANCCPSAALRPHLYPKSDGAFPDRLEAIYSASQRGQDAAVVDLVQERSRPQGHPEHGEYRRHSAGNGFDFHGAAQR
jgi:hypothetical protein